MASLQFDILQRDSSSHARLGRVRTAHGEFDTPAFMPVGTQGTVKGILPSQLRHDIGAQIILANTYHLMLRPGAEHVAARGGLPQWTRWQGPMLTDSGGFQAFSLAHINRIDDDGVTFQSHIDGASVKLTPERSMQVQNALGADIIMALDDCPPANAPDATPDDSPYRQRLQLASDRSARWLQRCIAAHHRPGDQALFGIIQGGTDLQQRQRCVEQVCQHDLPGYAIGGVAVGESPQAMHEVVQHTGPLMPMDKPRYLMGVGYERDIVAAVRAGVDMFDCVLPTRNGRNANAFTRQGQMRLRNAKFALEDQPIEPDCDCPACGHGFSRSYIRHLFMAREMLGPMLVSLHNLRHFQRLLLDIRRAIGHNDWSWFERSWPVASARARVS